MITKQVTVSGSVGKQVFLTDGTQPVRLLGLNLFAISAAAYVAIRDGNASGTVVLEHNALSNQSLPIEFSDEGYVFKKGMHVKVIGANAKAYLFID